MQHLSTAFLIFALAIVVNQVGATAQFYNYEANTDQLAQEAKNRAVTIIDGPKYVAPPSTPPPATPNNQTQPDHRPPSKPPIKPTPDKHGKPKYVELPRVYIGQILRNPYPKHVKIQHSPNSVYKYQKVVPLQQHSLYPKHQQLVFAASTSKPALAAKSPKFSLPVETINGIRADVVRPPHFASSTSTPPSTTTTATTTTRYLRTKRIWPKHILDKGKVSNTTGSTTTTDTPNTDNDLNSAASRIKLVFSDNVDAGSTQSSTRPPYRRVTRIPKKKPSTAAPANHTRFQQNDWVPIVPSHYPMKKVRKPSQTPISSRRSDRSQVYLFDPHESPYQNKRMYLQSFGLIPVASSPPPATPAPAARKHIFYVGKSKRLKPHVYSGYRGKTVVHTPPVNGDYQTDESDPMKIVTRIKHHHHHHHHRYVKTVEKPVRVEVPKPVPVPVPMPVKVQVDRKVPYPVPVKVPHPVPVKVIEKEYVPKPYPVYQQVPVVKHVQVKVPHPVPVPYEKRVPYPVKVEVPVPKPYPVAVPYEKKVPYPVPVRVLVPQPYPVETKVPVHVKEPVEVIKHVAIRVPVPQPYPVKVPHPVPVPYEKRVPYPVEVEKKVPVPIRVLVPEKVEVEKKVPVYVPKPYPVEKKVPVPFKVPYPVRIPVKVPVGVPILIHPSPNNNNFNNEQTVTSGITVGDNSQINQQQNSHFAFSIPGNVATTSQSAQYNTATETINNILDMITENPHRTVVTVHGKTGFGFQSRMDVGEESTTPYDVSASTETSLSTEHSATIQSPAETPSDVNITTISSADPR